MAKPLISVVVPMYNHENYIERALASIFEQDYRPTEIIAIDDGSKDRTYEIARNFLGRHAPSAIVLRRDNRGAAQTINQAMSLARGDYINILNSDDFFSPRRLSRCMDAVRRTGKQLVFTGVNFVDHTGQMASEDDYIRNLKNASLESRKLPTLGFALMRHQLAISTGNFFFASKLAWRVGPFQDYRYVHDWDFILRSLFFSEPAFIEDKLYNYRFHGENSFKSLANVAEYETSEVMRNFLCLMTSRVPENHRAPCPFFWPEVFEYYIRQWNYHIYLPPRFRHVLSEGERVL
ncbi:glycosyltransferase family 2 protein [Methylocystis rosea]|uniref:Glycosyltransferase family 2 protein n=1 Tax=Methylocystis rosea TaxID=173366 RepID=A0A3G8MB60_9HYPH|nr:glycosyltransferase family 2 protein [Methylocystis rosea]AZG78098.1 glycosyltransferase family 2 protein [Methylocystis rosea]